MTPHFHRFIFTSLIALSVSGCLATKVVTAPVKGAYYTTKGVYGVGKLATRGLLGVTKIAYKTSTGSARTVYQVGKVPVDIADAALDTSVKMLNITVLSLNAAGAVTSNAYIVSAAQLDAELAKFKTAENIVRVLVDVAR